MSSARFEPTISERERSQTVHRRNGHWDRLGVKDTEENCGQQDEMKSDGDCVVIQFGDSIIA
jgi:hypothetical protein